ncbi:response regulator [Halobacillus sp. Marseille-Q1614]|uniref:response regulator n=1 Tax=Halobacillus sp. Marseille-Q1614 TaxID=2709134 RepID=UPI00156FEF70|nr:response regulator [Halobacillus sp. Marseille-Q1614]
MKLLIVDDEPSMRELMQSLCEKDGLYADTASDGREGLYLFNKNHYDIIIVDYHMPILDGLEFVKQVRFENQQVPILVLTEDDREDVAAQFRQEGATDFSLKPIKPLDLISRIHLHIQIVNMRKRLAVEDDVYTAKGISKETLDSVASCLMDNETPKSVDEISSSVGLAYPTVYRYLMHLLEEGKVKQVIRHQKIGRPKKLYEWYTH